MPPPLATDDKLAAQLKQIFAASQAARDKVSAIPAEISAKQRELGSGSADPAALTAFQRFVDQICLGRRESAMLGCWIEGETQAFAATARPHGGSAGSPA